MSAGANFFFKPASGEHIETSVNITPDTAAAILGNVRDTGGRSVDNALVLLFKASGTGESTVIKKQLVDRQFTDSEGQFYFGPIEGDVLYQIKIYKNHVKLRELEIVAE